MVHLLATSITNLHLENAGLGFELQVPEVLDDLRVCNRCSHTIISFGELELESAGWVAGSSISSMTFDNKEVEVEDRLNPSNTITSSERSEVDVIEVVD